MTKRDDLTNVPVRLLVAAMILENEIKQRRLAAGESPSKTPGLVEVAEDEGLQALLQRSRQLCAEAKRITLQVKAQIERARRLQAELSALRRREQTAV